MKRTKKRHRWDDRSLGVEPGRAQRLLELSVGLRVAGIVTRAQEPSVKDFCLVVSRCAGTKNLVGVEGSRG